MSILTETTADSALVQFYKYYSYFTLFFSWTMSPVMFYVIITQSQNIGHFKWLILNHSIWCLCLETLIGVVKPVLLTPAYGGYQVGLLSSFTDYMSSGVSTIFCILFSINSVLGVVITILSRYTIIFPSKFQSLFKRKETYVVFFFTYVFVAVFTIFSQRSILNLTEDDLYSKPLKFDPELEQFFHHQTWFYIDPEKHRVDMVLIMVGSTSMVLGFIAVICTFLYQIQVNYKANYVSNELQKSLITSTLTHCGITIAFLIVPLYSYTSFIYFDVKNTSQLMVVLMCLNSTHCLCEFISTLLIITPYRKWVKRTLFGAKHTGRVVQVTTVSVSAMQSTAVKLMHK